MSLQENVEIIVKKKLNVMQWTVLTKLGKEKPVLVQSRPLIVDTHFLKQWVIQLWIRRLFIDYLYEIYRLHQFCVYYIDFTPVDLCRRHFLSL